MTTGVDKKKCECRVCVYGQKVRDLIHRTADATDKALLEELYNNLINAEDDREYYRIKYQGCAIKHGGISLGEACIAIDARRAKEEKAAK